MAVHVSYLDTVGVRANYDYLYKVLVIGDSAVGKSSLVERYVENNYDPHFISTIGVDFKIATFEWNGKIVKLQLWDTAGQERFRAITTAYYRGAHGIMLVYDVTSPDSVDNIQRVWMKEVTTYARPEAQLLLVGNKSDLSEAKPAEAAAAAAAVERLKEQYPTLRHIRTSAKCNSNVHEAFLELTNDMIQHEAKMERLSADKDAINLHGEGVGLGPTKSKCCF